VQFVRDRALTPVLAPGAGCRSFAPAAASVAQHPHERRPQRRFQGLSLLLRMFLKSAAAASDSSRPHGKSALLFYIRQSIAFRIEINSPSANVLIKTGYRGPRVPPR